MLEVIQKLHLDLWVEWFVEYLSNTSLIVTDPLCCLNWCL